jgi:hemerythrin-like domain-containing protein
MRSTWELIEDHRVVETVLRALDRQVAEGERTHTVPVEFLRTLVAFSHAFLDRCHHGKEEGCLFPCLERKGIPRDGGPIGVMLQEHEQGRVLVRQIAGRLDLYEQGAASDNGVLVLCREFSNLIHAHIQKENEMLFPMSDSVMDAADDRETTGCYEGKEQEMGHGAQRRLVELAERIALTLPGGARG